MQIERLAAGTTGQSFLLLNRTIRDQPQDLRIKPYVTRELLGIDLALLRSL
jgi:hypothetical protein